MRQQIRWLGLVTLLLCMPVTVVAQEGAYEVPQMPFMPFLSHPRYEDGGFYVGLEFLYWRTNQPLASQSIAVRGFRTTDDSVTGAANQFVGSAREVLNTNQLHGPTNFQPGWGVQLGWRFSDGWVVAFDWKHLVQARYTAVANVLPRGFNVGAQLENTFLFAPVANFGSDWSGLQNLDVGSPSGTYGIWNAATQMDIRLIQRFDIYQFNVRVPMWQSDDFRTYGIFGPRIAWIWDSFRWHSVDADPAGNANAASQARYSNMISNRMYGVHCGCGNDWFLGSTPIGGWSIELEGEAGLYANLVKTNAKYERADRAVSSGRARRHNTLVPSLEGRLNLKWYPYEAITFQVGYDAMMFFNTISSTKPVDFNLGLVDPQYEHYFLRCFHGCTFGVTFVF